ncbi:MAG: penicillin-binding protein activator [Desulfomonile sp.]|nr:penicillin-binding protein activator [Desulfomonile sp.]
MKQPIRYEDSVEDYEGESNRPFRSNSDCVPAVSSMSRWVMDRRHFLMQAGAAALSMIGWRSTAFAQDRPAIKVGFILPQKGPHAPEAQAIIAGFELFLAEHPEDTAFIQIVRKDPGPDEERTLEKLAELLLDGSVKFLVGPLTEEASEKVVHGGVGGRLVTFVTNPAVRLVGGEMCLPEVFRIAENACQATQPLAPWALRNVGKKVFLVGTDNIVSNEKVDFFAHMFERSGGMFVDRLAVSNGAAKLKDLVEAIRKSPADFVFAAFRDKLAVEFVKAVRAAQTSPPLSRPILGPESLTEYPSTLSREGRAANGIRTLSAIQDPKDLVSRIKQRLNRDVTHASRAAQGYDAAAVIRQALRVTADQRPDLPVLISAVEGAEVDGARGKLRFDKNHEPILDMMVQEWEVKEKAPQRRIVAHLGPFASPDFGCGRVGFPPRPEGEPPENDRPEEEG